MGDKFGSVPVSNRVTSEYVRELNKLEKKINAFDGQIDNNIELFTDFIQAYTSTKIARDLNAKQLERMYSNLSRKLSPEQASILKQLADVSNGTAKLSDIKFKNPKLNSFVQALAQQGDSLIGVTRSSIRAIQKTGKYAGEWLVAGIILYMVLSNLSDALGGGSSSKPKKQLRSRYED